MDSHTVYLLHFCQRYHHAGHYLGSSHNLTELKRQKNGVRLCPLCRGHQPEIGAHYQASRRPPQD
jgi:hypothetical protein